MLGGEASLGGQGNAGRPFPIDDSTSKHGGNGRVPTLARLRLD